MSKLTANIRLELEKQLERAIEDEGWYRKRFNDAAEEIEKLEEMIKGLDLLEQGCTYEPH